MREFLMSLLSGFSVGILFTAIKLPLPAPPNVSGIAGIVGIFLGFFVGLALDVVYFIYYTFATNLSEQNSHEVMSNCENILLISIIVLGILKAQNDYNSYRKGDKFY